MPVAAVNGISLSFEVYGSGKPVVLVTGTGARGRMWTPYQVPALTRAGYRVVTFDNRGVPPADTGPPGFTVADMVTDTASLIRYLGIEPCRIVGFSLGGVIVQELLLAHPELITQAVLMASRGRTDTLRAALCTARSELLANGDPVPARYAAVVHAMQYLSPCTLNDDKRIQDWLDIFEMSPEDLSVRKAQQDLDLIENRLEEYRKIRSQCLVIAFEDDLITPPSLCQEVASHIPGCKYEEIRQCGHYGYIENSTAVNTAIIDFFGEGLGAA